MDANTFQSQVNRVKQARVNQPDKNKEEFASDYANELVRVVKDLSSEMEVGRIKPEDYSDKRASNIICTAIALLAQICTERGMSLSEIMHRYCHTEIEWQSERDMELL